MRSVVVRALAVCLCGALGCSKETKVSEIEPNTGTFNGGEEISIKGSNFPRSGVAVNFGNRPAASVLVESDHTIKVTTPAGDKGTITDVSVLFDDGRAFVLKNGFSYIDSTQQRATMDKFFKETEKK